MGRFFELVQNAEQLARCVVEFPRDLLAIEVIDTCGSDGMYRKYA
jgi:hypothetical protein